MLKKRVIRTITYSIKYTHTYPLFTQLNILKLEGNNVLSNSIFIYKVINIIFTIAYTFAFDIYHFVVSLKMYFILCTSTWYLYFIVRPNKLSLSLSLWHLKIFRIIFSKVDLFEKLFIGKIVELFLSFSFLIKILFFVIVNNLIFLEKIGLIYSEF